MCLYASTAMALLVESTTVRFMSGTDFGRLDGDGQYSFEFRMVHS